MIYIIGTDHFIQHGDAMESEKIDEYYNYTKKIISNNKITVLAEESSVDAVAEFVEKNNCPKKTQLQSIAEEENCKHIFADPGKKESEKRGIKRRYNLLKERGINNKNVTHKLEWEINAEMAPYDYLREKIWLEKIEPYIKQDILFVCGYMHCETFKKLISEKDCKAEVIKVII